jgi:hypothetical protein
MQFLQVSLFGTSQKGVIEKMAYLVEFWLILERKLVESALHVIFVLWIFKWYTKY